MGDVIPVFKNKFLRKKEPFTRGAYGNVYMGNTTIKQTKVVFKEQFCRSHENATREIKILSKIVHANIVRLLDWEYFNDIFWMVLEYCNLGDLSEQCKRAKPTVMYTISVIRQAAVGLLYLHSMSPPIIHRDIQPRNILLHEENDVTIVKLCDFGLSKIANEEESTDRWLVSKAIGTPLFRAPEMVDKDQYTSSLDTFSLGLCLESMYHYGQGKSDEFLPVRAYPPLHLSYKSFGEFLYAKKTSCSIVQYQTNDEKIHRKIKDLINEMTQFDIMERPKMCKVIETLDQLPKGTPNREPEIGGRLENEGTQIQLPGDDRYETHCQECCSGLRTRCQTCCSGLRTRCDVCCTDCGELCSECGECCSDCCEGCCDCVVETCKECCGQAGLIGVGVSYILTFILLTSLGMWLATDDDYNCVNTTRTSDIKTIALVTSILGFTVPIAPLVAACCGGAEVGGVIGVLAFFAHLGMSLYGMDLGCKAWARGTCEDRIVEFMCTSGAVLGFLAVTVIVCAIIGACIRQ